MIQKSPIRSCSAEVAGSRSLGNSKYDAAAGVPGVRELQVPTCAAPGLFRLLYLVPFRAAGGGGKMMPEGVAAAPRQPRAGECARGALDLGLVLPCCAAGRGLAWERHEWSWA